MQPPETFHFDSARFFFAIKWLAVIAILFAGVRYGTVFASELILEPAERAIEEAEQRLEELKQSRPERTPLDFSLLERLQEFENTLATRSIGTPSLETLSNAHKKMIAADLGAMKLHLYENGRIIETFDIAAKGKRGSRWETPTGLYEIEFRSEDHFSSIGKVHMPYSMQFFGNFFVHGWPYYPGGEPVAESFSGGCIRLSTEDSRKVFEFAHVGTPIFVWEEAATSTISIRLKNQRTPRTGAKAFIIADIKTGEVYAEYNADRALPMASVTKLMTALVGNETIHYDRLLSVTSDDRGATDGTPGNILLNDLVTVGDALYALLLESNNSVAYTLARYHGYEKFMGWMNDKAQAIGMQHTFYEDPSGISPNNVASANDLFRLMRYIHDSQSYILNMSREQSKSIISESGSRYVLGNFNHFSGMKEFLGGKVGYTPEALQTMATVFEVPIRNSTSTATIAIVVLGTDDRKRDVLALLNWFKNSAYVAQ